jgi:ATP-dependent DNA helicase RecG
VVTSPEITLETPVQFLKGIGPKRAEALGSAGIVMVENLLNHFPRRYLDRSRMTPIRSLKPGEEVTVMGKVYSMEMVRARSKRFVVLVGDGTGFLQCVWFHTAPYLTKMFEIGDVVAFSGKVGFYRGPQLTHPEFDRISGSGESDALNTRGIIPLYPSSETLVSAGFDSRGFRRVLKSLSTHVTGLVHETLPNSILAHQKLMKLAEAFHQIHFPSDWPALEAAQRRLKFDEFFTIQLFLALDRRSRELERKGVAFTVVGDKTLRLIENLPFELTEAQKRVIREIREDMRREHAMNRLLQGDVGSGKTIVALLAILIAVENGYQAAIMAPTEILAEQHFLTIHGMLEELGVKVTLIKGGQTSAARRNALEGIANGDIQVAVGTHALVQEGVEFQKLGFVVIDEQHRFGVMQRAVLRQKGWYPDVLVMTATPIPRTLALTLYGDLDVSILDELPKGRIPVRTVWRSEDKRRAIYDFVRKEAGNGRQAYIVYPLVEESERSDLAAATKGQKTLSQSVFPEFKVGLLHGRMKSAEKESVMREFKAGDIQILVSTTVIEVGVDVPNATVMIIEHAERFGLTQLHQLRGRVGRGKDHSLCVLLGQEPLSEDAKKRIEAMTSTNDGFKIAEADLELRGAGELFGTRQHGLLNFKLANLVTDGAILSVAREEALRLVHTDPALDQPEHRNLRTLYSQSRKRFGLLEVG